MVTIVADNVHFIQGLTAAEDFTCSVVANPTVVIDGSITTPTVGDTITSLNSDATIDNNTQVSVALPTGKTASITTTTPAICTVAQDGTAARISDGTGVIKVAVAGCGVRKLTHSFARTGGATVYTMTGFTANSVAKHIDTAIKAMVAGKTPNAATLNLWTSNTGIAGVRNASMFASSLDLSAIGLGSSGGGTVARKPVLISPYHIISAAHFPPSGTVSFLGTNNETYFTGTIGNSLRIGTANYNDMLIQEITWDGSAPTDADIKFMRVLPVTFGNYLPNNILGGVLNTSRMVYPVMQVPALWKRAATGDTMVVAAVSLNEKYWCDCGYPPLDIVLADWNPGTGPIDGDSGSPIIFPISEGGPGTTSYIPVLLGVLHYSGYSGNMEPLHMNIIEIQAAMDTLHAGHTLLTVDLSLFTNFAA